MTVADEIRQYATRHYIEPARRQGRKAVHIRAGDVHDALDLTMQHANVCQALVGRKFQEQSGVRHVEDAYEGPPSRAGANSTFHYEIDLSWDQNQVVDSIDSGDTELRERVLELTPREFEELALEYLKAKGFSNAEITVVLKMTM